MRPKGLDVIAVLSNDFGKSLLFQLLPDFLPVKEDKSIDLCLPSKLNYKRPTTQRFDRVKV